MKRVLLLKILLCYVTIASFSQHSSENKLNKSHHTLSVIISHTQISQGIQANGDRKWLSLPSWGLNYNYIFNKKWALGLHTDIIVEDFVVQEHLKSSNGQVLERAYPIATTLMTTYKPRKHLAYVLGFGNEFASSGSLFLVRAGLEYGWHINEKWELVSLLTNDFRFNAFNSWAIGLGITKTL